MADQNRAADETGAEKKEPREITPGEGGGSGKSSTGLDPKLGAFLAYFLSIFISFVGGLVIFLLERENKFIRFHALQSILFNVAVIVISIALVIITVILVFVPILGWVAAVVLWLVFGIGAFVLWVVLMVKSLQGEYYKLPVIGDWSDQNA